MVWPGAEAAATPASFSFFYPSAALPFSISLAETVSRRNPNGNCSFSHILAYGGGRRANGSPKNKNEERERQRKIKSENDTKDRKNMKSTRRQH